MSESFFERVYSVVRKIPEGKVTSYVAIANYLGTPKSARVVGWAMNASHDLDDVPAHRVVNRNGLLTGKHFFSGSNLMRELLESEGIKIENDKIHSFFALDGEVSLKEFDLKKGDFFTVSKVENIMITAQKSSKLFEISSPIKPSYKTYSN